MRMFNLKLSLMHFLTICFLICLNSNLLFAEHSSQDTIYTEENIVRARQLMVISSGIIEGISAFIFKFSYDIPYLGSAHFLQKDWLSGSFYLVSEIGILKLKDYFYKRIPPRDFVHYPNRSNDAIFYSNNAHGFRAQDYKYLSFVNIAYHSLLHLRLIDIYSAYRNLHSKTSSINKVKMNTESIPSLALSPFKWKYLKKKWVFIPIAIAGATALLEPLEGRSISKAKSVTMFGNRYNPYGAVLLSSSIDVYQFSFVATAEEVYWRGIIQTELTEATNPTFAWISSSLLFGLWHVPLRGWAIGAIATVAGGYLGYRYKNNGYDLGEVIALHFWIDWLPTVIEFIRNPKDGLVFSIEWKL